MDARSNGKNELRTAADAPPTAADTEGGRDPALTARAAVTARYWASERYVSMRLTAACAFEAGGRATTSATARWFHRTLVLTLTLSVSTRGAAGLSVHAAAASVTMSTRAGRDVRLVQIMVSSESGELHRGVRQVGRNPDIC
jgi:hypothetical protein